MSLRRRKFRNYFGNLITTDVKCKKEESKQIAVAIEKFQDMALDFCQSKPINEAKNPDALNVMCDRS